MDKQLPPRLRHAANQQTEMLSSTPRSREQVSYKNSSGNNNNKNIIIMTSSLRRRPEMHTRRRHPHKERASTPIILLLLQFNYSSVRQANNKLTIRPHQQHHHLLLLLPSSSCKRVGGRHKALFVAKYLQRVYRVGGLVELFAEQGYCLTRCSTTTLSTGH